MISWLWKLKFFLKNQCSGGSDHSWLISWFLSVHSLDSFTQSALFKLFLACRLSLLSLRAALYPASTQMLPFQVVSDSISVIPVVTVVSVVSAGLFVASGVQDLHTEGQGGPRARDPAKYNRVVKIHSDYDVFLKERLL